jgi:hypothetical protein
MKHIKLFENFTDKNKSEYKAVKKGEGKWEIHIKNPADNDFNAPKSGSVWTNNGKYYSSEGEANDVIKSLLNVFGGDTDTDSEE